MKARVTADHKGPRRMMNGVRTAAIALVCTGLAALAGAQQSADRITIPFSDPSRTGTVKVSVISGSVTVHGTSRRDVTVSAQGRGDERPRRATEPPPGLHRLTQSAGFDAEEANNVISIGGPPANRPLDLDIELPAKSNLQVSTVNNGTITVDGVEGDLEVGNVNGSITLTNVAGSVVAHTVNGPLTAKILRVTPDKAMAFTSLNGNVDVTIPSATKANLKLRSDQGDVFTDFDVQLKTNPPAPVENRGRGGRYRIEVNRAIYGAINGGGPDFELRTFNGNVYVRKGN